MNIEAEVNELISRLTDSERHDLLESLRKRWNDERKELKSIYGVSHEQVQARTTAAEN
jgi:hypothetical protein